MNLKNFKKLLAVPTKSFEEEKMVEYLTSYCTAKGVNVRSDRHNNVYVIKGDTTKPLPCLAAHIDSVQPIRKIRIVESDGRFHGEFEGQCVGMGADDKTGVQVCLELLDRFENIALAFFAGEECGCFGASRSDAEFFKKLGYIIEFDCPSRNMMSYTSGGVRLFENHGDFIKTALPVLQKHGTNLWQHHPYTDVMALRKRFPISCLNLSSGYYNWHASSEFAKINEVEMAIEEGEDLVKALDSKFYPCPLDISRTDEGETLVPITTLTVPAP